MKSYRFLLLVSLKGADLWALTAYRTLTEDMGIGGLKRLERRTLWILQIEAESVQEAIMKAKKVGGKKVFVNPNKHRYNIFLARESVFGAKRQQDVWCMNALVSEKGGQEHNLGIVQREYEGLKNIERFTLWSLFIKASTLSEAKRIAEDIVVLKDRRRGLLANPFSQRYKIL
jgi:hypothetical protein